MAEAPKKRGDLGKEKSKPSKSSKSKSKKKSKKKVREIALRRAESGHLLATHKHDPDPEEMGAMGGGGTPPDEEHVINPGELQQHVDEHLPLPGGGGGQEQQAQAMPQPQPGSQMGGM
jgi:hypothetical protein